MAKPINLKDKLCYFVVTGASRGIGQKMAIETAKNFKNGSVVLLLARSEKGLLETKAKILENNPNLEVIVDALDLTKPTPETFKSLIQDSFKKGKNFDLAFIIHNVGTIGDITKKAKDHETYQELQDYYSVNVFAPIILNTQFLKNIPGSVDKLIINVSSKAASVPICSFSQYCSGKASREMFFKVLAEEEKSNNVRVLNYCPGPVETEMTDHAILESCDDGVKGYFKNLHETKTILSTAQTTKRFLEILEKGAFENGAQIDYYDAI